MARPLYLTTTLPYVNADPHIGFALEIVHADIIARWHEIFGDEVFFNTGTDEHGLKIYRKALEEGKDPQAYIGEYAQKFKELQPLLGLSPSLHFIRTTDPHHQQAAQELWKRCAAKGDIYKKKYRGLYCVGDEVFIKESELVDGRCPNHPTTEPIEIAEENYFFRLSAYQEKLLEYLSRADSIIPDWRRTEAIEFVKRGLEDFSISRDKVRLPWGVPVPGDDSQTIYVWFDALTNYISTLGWPEDREGNFKKFWAEGDTVQFAGKDQVRFQSIMWQAMLMSAGLPNTKTVVYHGFITSGGAKMSKSLGNVIAPADLVKEFGVDATRWFLAHRVSFYEDSDVTLERVREVYNAELANGIGNLAARILMMAEMQLPVAPAIPEMTVPQDYEDALAGFNVNAAANIVWEWIGRLDRKIQETEPFKTVKTNPEYAKSVVTKLVIDLYTVARMLNAIMPATSQAIKEAIKANKKSENLFPRKE